MVTVCTAKFNAQKSYIMHTHTQRILCVFIYIRTNSDYFRLPGFYNRDTD
jgi:hypothetical protein